jgi:hypothetical protein
MTDHPRQSSLPRRCLSWCYHTTEAIPSAWGASAVIDCIQAVEVIKYLVGIGEVFN